MVKATKIPIKSIKEAITALDDNGVDTDKMFLVTNGMTKDTIIMNERDLKQLEKWEEKEDD